MKLLYFINKEENKVYTLKNSKVKKTKEAHYKFIKFIEYPKEESSSII